MSTVEEIEKAIERLPRSEFFKLRDWVRYRFEDEWDREFQEDAESGALDSLAEEAIAEYRKGKTEAFPPDEQPRNA